MGQIFYDIQNSSVFQKSFFSHVNVFSCDCVSCVVIRVVQMGWSFFFCFSADGMVFISRRDCGTNWRCQLAVNITKHCILIQEVGCQAQRKIYR